MFVAKFSQTTGAPFIADNNGNFPYIGEVKAGTAKGTLINGTMFKRNGLSTDKLYACENFVDPEYPTNVQVEIVSAVSIVEYLELRTLLGAPRVTIGAKAVDAAEELV